MDERLVRLFLKHPRGSNYRPGDRRWPRRERKVDFGLRRAHRIMTEVAAPGRRGLEMLTLSLLFVAWLAIKPGETSAAEGKSRVWHGAPESRWTSLEVSGPDQTGFTLLSPKQTGIEFTNILLEFSAATNRVLENGSGIALGDYDGDGRLDIFACGLDTPSALFRNLGHWHFTNVTAGSGLAFAGKYQRGAVFADVNGDRAPDLLVSTLNQGVLCFLNDGAGHFRDATAAAGTTSQFGSATMALADVDGNGTLDLYVANYRSDDIRNRGSVQVYRRNGEYIIPPDLTNRLVVLNNVVREVGDPDILYLNDGQGQFTAVPWTGGRFVDEAGNPLTAPPLDWGQTASFRDLNGDGAPDLYVCNDFWTVDRIWINDGKGTFRAIAPLALRHVCFSSMGVDFADVDRDGFLDLFVTDMQSRDPRLRKRQIYAFNPQSPPFDPMQPPAGVISDRPQVMRNTLFWNRGDSTYADIADYSGVSSAEWAWQQIFLDVDLDGYEDLLIAAGFYRDVQDRDAIAATSARRSPPLKGSSPTTLQLASALDRMTNSRRFPAYHCPIVAFRNLGNLRFEDVTESWGTAELGVHQGIAVGDLDNDGAMDLALNDCNGALQLYRNNSIAGRLAVRLRGRSPNTEGTGAKVRLLGGAVPMQSQEIVSGGRYLSGSEPMIVFAAGKQSRAMTLEVTWRSGQKIVIRNIEPNRLYEIAEGVAEPTVSSSIPNSPLNEPTNSKGIEASPRGSGFATQPYFQDVTSKLNHFHRDEPYNDFVRQPLLPRRLSQLGPGVAWWDINGDGHDDLIIGSGKSGTPGLFLGDGLGQFQPIQNAFTTNQVSFDQLGVLGWLPERGQSSILIAAANYENPGKTGSTIARYTWPANGPERLNPEFESSIGPLALGPLDDDGGLELFVGGRVVPGRWPTAATSAIYRYRGGQLVLDQAKSKALANIGLVGGAVFSDVDGDGRSELILACEWGPIRVFAARDGTLQELSAKLGLDRWTGWWNGVATGDLDGDGRLDIVAANWGLNSPYRATFEHPTEVRYGELSGRGLVDVVEAEFEPEINGLAPRRPLDALIASLPYLSDKFANHRAFSEARLDAVLAPARGPAVRLQANTLASLVFLNRGDRFEAKPMPREAQLAPAFSPVVADFDGDGREDVFLSQNFFGTEPSTPRLDAGRGLLMLGNGHGELQPVSGQASGIQVYGEQRSAAAGDFNEDGKIDLVVCQNNGPTRLFQNLWAQAGVRIRLRGPDHNPAGIGAVLRLSSEGTTRPVREIHAGSGYLSQDSVVAVLPRFPGACELEVQWPGGKKSRMTMPAGTREWVTEYR